MEFFQNLDQSKMEQLALQINQYGNQYIEEQKKIDIDQIVQVKPIAIRVSHLYTDVYNLLTPKKPEETIDDLAFQLYKQYCELLNCFLNEIVVLTLETASPPQYFPQYIKGCEKYQFFQKFLMRIFKYLDHLGIKDTIKLEAMSWNIFQMKIFSRCKIQLLENFREQLIEVICDDSHVDQQNQLLSFCNYLVTMSQNDNFKTDNYLHQFRQSILQRTKQIYNQKYNSWLEEQIPTPIFLKQLQVFINRQCTLINTIFEPIVLKKKNINLKSEILSQLKEDILLKYKLVLLSNENQHGFINMLVTFFDCELQENEDLNTESLKVVYEIYVQLDDKFDKIRQTFKEYIINRGKEIIQAKIQQVKNGQSDNDDFIIKLFELQKQSNRILTECFKDDVNFRESQKDAFENFINERIIDQEVSEYLAQFCNKAFLNSVDQKSLKKQMNQVINLYSYLAEKDLFIAVYQRLLANRLLTNKSTRETDEMLMLDMIRIISGASTINPLEDMLNEIKDTKITEQFNEMQFIKDEIDFEVDIRILQKSSWPNFREFNQQPLTPEIGTVQCYCEEIYSKIGPHYQFRHLTWMNSISLVVLSYKAEQIYEIYVTVNQAQILFQYQIENDELSLQHFLEVTKLDEVDLLKNLNALEETGLLQKTNNNYSFNEQFQSNTVDVRVPYCFSREYLSSKKELEQDREQLVKAAIVKIMKKHKSILFQELQIEVKEALKKIYLPSINLMKEILEKLIRQDLIQRDVQPDLLHYQV